MTPAERVALETIPVLKPHCPSYEYTRLATSPKYFVKNKRMRSACAKKCATPKSESRCCDPIEDEKDDQGLVRIWCP